MCGDGQNSQTAAEDHSEEQRLARTAGPHCRGQIPRHLTPLPAGEDHAADRCGTPASHTLANWMIKPGSLIQPLTNLLQDRLRAYDILGMDETPIQVLKEPRRKTTATSYLWVQ